MVSHIDCPFCAAAQKDSVLISKNANVEDDCREAVSGSNDYLECPTCGYQEEDTNTSKAA